MSLHFVFTIGKQLPATLSASFNRVHSVLSSLWKSLSFSHFLASTQKRWAILLISKASDVIFRYYLMDSIKRNGNVLEFHKVYSFSISFFILWANHHHHQYTKIEQHYLIMPRNFAYTNLSPVKLNLWQNTSKTRNINSKERNNLLFPHFEHWTTRLIGVFECVI